MDNLDVYYVPSDSERSLTGATPGTDRETLPWPDSSPVAGLSSANGTLSERFTPLDEAMDIQIGLTHYIYG